MRFVNNNPMVSMMVRVFECGGANNDIGRCELGSRSSFLRWRMKDYDTKTRSVLLDFLLPLSKQGDRCNYECSLHFVGGWCDARVHGDESNDDGCLSHSDFRAQPPRLDGPFLFNIQHEGYTLLLVVV